MDNTFAGFHNHGQYGVDVFVHSLTKYASGHGDVMGGAVIARTEVAREIRREAVLLGPLLDPHAAFLVMRGMKTYYLRYEAQAASALAIARFLAEHPAVERVHYPGLPDHPRHALARSQMREFGTHRHLRPCAGRRGRAAVRGRARILRDHAEPRLGGVAGDAAAAPEGAGPAGGIQAMSGRRRGDGAAVDRHRGYGRPHRGPGGGPGQVVD